MFYSLELCFMSFANQLLFSVCKIKLKYYRIFVCVCVIIVFYNINVNQILFVCALNKT